MGILSGYLGGAQASDDDAPTEGSLGLSSLLTTTTTAPPPPTPTTTAPPAPSLTGGGLGLSGLLTGGSPTPAPAPAPTQPGTFNDGADVERGMRVVNWIMENGAVPVADDQQMRDMVGALARIYFSGDDEAKAAAESIMLRASNVVPDEMWEQYGLTRRTDTQGGFTNFGGRFMQNARNTAGVMAGAAFGDNPFGNYVGRPLASALNSTQQAMTHTVSAGRQTRVSDALMNLTEGVANIALNVGSLGHYNVEKYQRDLNRLFNRDRTTSMQRERDRWDLNDDTMIEFAEMLGRQTNSNGRFGRVGGIVFELANFLGGETIDIQNYFTLGGSAAAGGLDVAEEMFGTAARNAIERQGIDAVLDASEQAALHARIRGSIETAFSEEGRRRTIYEALRKLDPSEVADKRLQEALVALQNGRGVHFAGMRIPGSEAVQNFPGRRRSEYVGRADDIARRELIAVDPTDIGAVDRAFGDRINIMDAKYVDGDELQEWMDSPFELTPNGSVTPTSATRFEYTLRLPKEGPEMPGHRLPGQSAPAEDLGVGTMTLFDDGTAVLDTFTKLPGTQGTKIGRQMLRELVPTLEQNGFHTIRIQAVDDGPWVWGKEGFVIDTSRADEVQEWLDHLDTKLDQFDESILPPPRVTFTRAEEPEFTEAISAARAQDRGGQRVGLTVHQYSPEEYAQMDLYLSDDGLTGYAIKPDGDIVSVFNVGEGGLLPDIMNDALQNGGRKLDAFEQKPWTRPAEELGFPLEIDQATLGRLSDEATTTVDEVDAAAGAAREANPWATVNEMGVTHPIGGLDTVERELYDSYEGYIDNIMEEPEPFIGYSERSMADLAAEHALDVNNRRVEEAIDNLLPEEEIVPPRNLKELYGEFGFEEVDRVEFRDEWAPEGWDPNVQGRPDTVYMQRPEVMTQGSLGELSADALFVNDAAGRRAALTSLRDRIARARENPNAVNMAALGDPSGPNWQALGELIGGDWGSVPMVRGITNVPGGGVVNRIVKPGLAQQLRSTSGGRFIGERMAPRTDVKRVKGTRTAERIYRARERAEHISRHQLDDSIGQMTKLQRAAQAELKDPELLNRVLRDAFETTDDDLVYETGDAVTGQVVTAKLDHEDLLSAEIATLRNDGLTATADYLEALSDLRRYGDEAAVRSGLPEDFLREGYFPRIMTQEGEEAVRVSQNIMERFQLDPNSNVSLHEQMFHQAREWNPNMTIDAANETARRIFALEDGVKLFEDDPLVAFALRSQSSFTAAANMDMLDEIVTLTDDTGGMIAVWGKESLEFDKTLVRRFKSQNKNWVEVATPRGPILTSPEVAKELHNVRAIMYNDQILEHTRSVLDRWSQIWGTYATVPLADGLGFHMRNGYGNVMLNLMAGVYNPEVYIHAAFLQNAAFRARRRMGRSDSPFARMTFDEILEHPELGLSRRNQNLLRGARERGVIGDGFFQDLAPDELDTIYRATPRGKAGELAQKGADKLLDNPIVRRGRALGTAVENNARLAHYVDKINKGWSAENAAASVRRYLFDYGDLTPFERKHFRTISRFYTFMRKNTGVQTWAIVNNPAGMARQMRAHAALVESEDNGEQGMIPDYAREQGILGTKWMGGYAMAPESVFNAALEPYNAAWKIADQIPGLKELLPGDTAGGDTATAVLGLLSGGPLSFLEFLYETQSGETWYGASTEERGTEGDLRRFADSLLPLWGPLDRFVTEISAGALADTDGIWGLGNNPTSTQSDMSLGAALVKNLLGWNVVPLGESAERSVIYSLSAELDEILEAAKLRGIDIGTQQDLRELGLIPELPDIAADAGLSHGRLPSIVMRERLEAQGMDPMEDEEYIAQLEKERRLGYDVVTKAEVEAWSEQAGISPEQTAALVEDLEGRYTTRDTRGQEFATAAGWVDADGQAAMDFRTKAHYNAANPEDPFLDSKGNVITLADWQAWVAEDGVRYFDEPNADGEWYSTRSMRERDLAVQSGLLTESGEPQNNNLTAAWYNLHNPDDPIRDKEGRIIDYRRVDVVMPGSTMAKVKDWARAQGYDFNYSRSAPADVVRAFNAAHPSAPYYKPREWIESGYKPLQGVYTITQDGRTYEYWPEGMSETNWWIPDAPRPVSGTSALGAQEDSGGLLSGLLGSG